MGAKCRYGVGKSCILRPVQKYPAETPYRGKYVSIRHVGQRPRRCAGGRIRRGVINI